MSVRMIEQLFSKRTRNSLGKIVSPRQDLTFAQLKIYYDAKGLQLNDNFAKNLELLTKDGKYNYAAYLIADNNNISIKVAKYVGTDRVDLVESNEYGYCSLIKATKAVLDKIELENRTLTQITSKERLEERLWDDIAIREAVINAVIHNDYTNEIPPKFEIFEDRLEITSTGSLPEGMDTQEFFEGVSNPRNKEIMRIYKDLDMVEQLGSGVPRILRTYNKDSFVFMNNFMRMIFKKQIGGQIGGQTSSVQLTDRQKDVLSLIRQNNKVSRKSLSELLDIAESAVQKHLEALKDKDVIKREGGSRGWWEILK
jgi:predicted HTH transcriptional regulator